jgi:hypothetical protein
VEQRVLLLPVVTSPSVGSRYARVEGLTLAQDACSTVSNVKLIPEILMIIMISWKFLVALWETLELLCTLTVHAGDGI